MAKFNRAVERERSAGLPAMARMVMRGEADETPILSAIGGD
jgi:hypothetical protein